MHRVQLATALTSFTVAAERATAFSADGIVWGVSEVGVTSSAAATATSSVVAAAVVVLALTLSSLTSLGTS